ncbi:hypothetical protein [Paenibacillus apiarius]|uniref:hypothetical protein n=1 Tax=Paenibacillus apiarius TaxID=46240 RepID=UPI0019807AFC|nr:hypothetical protein [Paenibacillus apiarius]MBN3526412.1 hypothetical protein [Paenibacillus apiarius]
MKEGIAELFGNQTLLPPTLTILFTNFATSLVIGVLIFYAVDGLGSSPQEVGWMFSVSAFGGIAGAKGLKMLRKKWKRGAIFHAMLSSISFIWRFARNLPPIICWDASQALLRCS